MANTFELISSVTVGAGGAASIDFTSIPATYTDLCLYFSGRSSLESTVSIRFNGSSSGLTGIYLYGNGYASPVSGSLVPSFFIEEPSQTANTFASSTCYIPNYTSSNYKSLSIESTQENNAASSQMILQAGLWSNTAAITSLSIVSGSSSVITQYSTAYLYGVKNA